MSLAARYNQRHQRPGSPQATPGRQGRHSLRDINFKYSEKPVLRGINLTVKAGQMVALVGNSGSGKTTLTNLLLRFYDPQSGSVRIGGTDIRQVAIKDLPAASCARGAGNDPF